MLFIFGVALLNQAAKLVYQSILLLNLTIIFSFRVKVRHVRLKNNYNLFYEIKSKSL